MNKIDEFLNEYTAKETIRQYKISLKKYFNYHNQNPDIYVKDIRNLDNGKRNKIMDQYEIDITNYRNHLTKQDYSPKCIHNYISSVKMFLEHYRIDLDKAFWKKLKSRGIEKVVESVCDFKIPTPAQLKQILTHANTKIRSISLLQSSSGMRIGEICNLTLNDIDLDYKFPHITIRKPKTKMKGRTRCSPEAKEAIQEWLKIRPDNDDPRLFQCKPKVARTMWNRILKQSGYAKKDKNGKYPRNLMGTHSLRRYFRNEFSKYNNNLAAYLMNQRTGLDRKYRDWSDEYLDEQYARGVDHLLVFQQNVTDERLNSMQEQMENKDMAITEMQGKIEQLEHDTRLFLEVIDRLGK